MSKLKVFAAKTSTGQITDIIICKTKEEAICYFEGRYPGGADHMNEIDFEKQFEDDPFRKFIVLLREDKPKPIGIK